MSLSAAQWNARYPIGTPVTAYPVARPEDPEATWACDRLNSRTSSAAWTFSHGIPVVQVEGHTGGIALTHVDPVVAGGDVRG